MFLIFIFSLVLKISSDISEPFVMKSEQFGHIESISVLAEQVVRSVLDCLITFEF